MDAKKLKQWEHEGTRTLYEEVFCEDTRAFVDYYYKNCARTNEIYGVMDRENLCAMLHLNPYEMRLGPWQGECNYIVAVATRKEYRHQGLMTKLLKKSMEDMYEKGQPFTFLMPASEAIYRPFDFRFIYRQRQGWLKGAHVPQEEGLCLRKAAKEDIKELARFAKGPLSPYQTAAIHSEAYFSRMLREQECQKGEIMLICRLGEICGYFFTSRENGLEVREAVAAPEDMEYLFPAIRAWADGKDVRLFSWPEEMKEQEGLLEDKKVPMIMARVIRLDVLARCLRAEEPVSLSFEMRDSMLPQNQGIYCLKLDQEKSQLYRAQTVPEWVVDAGVFTQLAFGCMEVEAPEKVKEKLSKVRSLAPVFLNEIV